MTRRILIVAHPGVTGMELLGARDIFEIVNTWRGLSRKPPAYQVEVATLDGTPAQLSGGMELGPARRLRGWRSPVDTLVVVGGYHAVEASEDAALTAAVRTAAGKARRVVGLCTGSFILAAAGLLDGMRVTTHWMFGETLAARHPFRELQQFISDHPDADLSLPALAARMHMSPRHFARVFRAETGASPGRYVERMRLETARRRLEESHLPVAAVASACGFGSYQSMRRAFVAVLGARRLKNRGESRGQDDRRLPVAEHDHA